MNTDSTPHYRVEYYDNHLEVDDFVNFQADSESEAEEKFWEEYDESRYDIQEVEHSYNIPEIIQ